MCIYFRISRDAKIFSQGFGRPGLKFIKLEYTLKLKIKRNGWLLAQAANHCALF